MPVIDFIGTEGITVGDGYSAARGVFMTGERIEFVAASFAAGTGAVRHHHPHEQMAYVASGRFRVTIGDETFELTACQGWHAPPNVPHQVDAIEDSVMITGKNLIDREAHMAAPTRDS